MKILHLSACERCVRLTNDIYIHARCVRLVLPPRKGIIKLVNGTWHMFVIKDGYHSQVMNRTNE